jgi:hypothetical protein
MKDDNYRQNALLTVSQRTKTAVYHDIVVQIRYLGLALLFVRVTRPRLRYEDSTEALGATTKDIM